MAIYAQTNLLNELSKRINEASKHSNLEMKLQMLQLTFIPALIHTQLPCSNHYMGNISRWTTYKAMAMLYTLVVSYTATSLRALPPQLNSYLESFTVCHTNPPPQQSTMLTKWYMLTHSPAVALAPTTSSTSTSCAPPAVQHTDILTESLQ